MKARHIDLTGRRFGRVTALEFAGTNDSGNAVWRCECACGKQFMALASNLQLGKTKSCGCYRSEATAKRNKLKAKRPKKKRMLT